jgi:hypothetical protein
VAGLSLIGATLAPARLMPARSITVGGVGAGAVLPSSEVSRWARWRLRVRITDTDTATTPAITHTMTDITAVTASSGSAWSTARTDPS